MVRVIGLCYAYLCFHTFSLTLCSVLLHALQTLPLSSFVDKLLFDFELSSSSGMVDSAALVLFSSVALLLASSAVDLADFSKLVIKVKL